MREDRALPKEKEESKTAKVDKQEGDISGDESARSDNAEFASMTAAP